MFGTVLLVQIHLQGVLLRQYSYRVHILLYHVFSNLCHAMSPKVICLLRVKRRSDLVFDLQHIPRKSITPLHYLLIHEQEGERRENWRYMYRDKTRNMIVRLDGR
jgi:hypothetical protein